VRGVNILRVADQIVNFIAQVCSSKVFLLTGNGAMYINDAMQVHPNIEYVCVRNEAVAPVAASAFSQLTGRIGTVCVTAGPGAANAMPGIVEAWVDGVSIFVVSGQVPSLEKDNYGRNFEREQRTFGIAGIPITDYVQQFTKLAIELVNPMELESALEKILEAFYIGRPGPVWLDVPLDVQAAECDEINLDSLILRVNLKKRKVRDLRISLHETKLISMAIKDSKRPLFIIGGGAEGVITDNTLVEWLESYKLVFALSRPSAHKIRLSTLGNLGVLGVRGRPWSKNIFNEVDLIVGLGTRLPSSLVGPNYSYLEDDTRIILINSEPSEFKRHAGKVINTTPMRIEEFINSIPINEVLSKHLEIDLWQQKAMEIKQKHLRTHVSMEGEPLNIYWFCENLEKSLNSTNVLTTDAGSNYYACGQAMSFESGFKEVTSGTFASMGISVPLAIGSALAFENNNRIICVTGDGSIELNVQELQTISNYNLNIAIFVINNGGYASMRAWQDTFFESRYIGSTDDTGTRPMNFAKIASAFDLKFEQIANTLDYENKIQNILKSNSPILIEVICDPNQILELPMISDIV
jgi:acetolactate synthase-1/2/3 large subunit